MAQPWYDEWREITPWHEQVVTIGIWPATLGKIIGRKWIIIESDIKLLKPEVEKN